MGDVVDGDRLDAVGFARAAIDKHHILLVDGFGLIGPLPENDSAGLFWVEPNGDVGALILRVVPLLIGNPHGGLRDFIALGCRVVSDVDLAWDGFESLIVARGLGALGKSKDLAGQALGDGEDRALVAQSEYAV